MTTVRERITPLSATLALTSIAVLASVLIACPAQTPDRRLEVIEGIAETPIDSSLGRALVDAGALHEASVALCAAPSSASLDAAQDAWWTLRGPWKTFMALPLGPVVDDGFDSAIDFWPARPNSVEGGIDSGASSQAEIDALGVASKGLPAIEYLLWGLEGDDAGVLSSLEGDTGERRCDYIRALAADLEVRFTALESAQDSFSAQLVGAGDNARYPSVALAIDELLNAAIAGLHNTSERALGKPLGVSAGADPQPNSLESRFSTRSRQDTLDALAGFRLFYLGADAGGVGPGFTVLVSEPSAEIDAAVRTQLSAAIAALEALPEPLLASDPPGPASEPAWNAVRELRLTLTADVAGLLGVTVSLTDNDGD